MAVHTELRIERSPRLRITRGGDRVRQPNQETEAENRNYPEHTSIHIATFVRKIISRGLWPDDYTARLHQACNEACATIVSPSGMVPEGTRKCQEAGREEQGVWRHGTPPASVRAGA